MSEPITSRADAVRVLGAPPVPVGPEPQALSAERLAGIAVRRSEAVEVAALACWPLHEYRLIKQALTDEAVLLADNERLRARVAELEDERHSTNESLSDAAEALRANRDRIAELEESPLAWADQLDPKSLDNFLICLSTATEYEPMCGAIDEIHQLIRSYREHVESGPSVQRSADKLTALLAPSQVLREDADAEAGERP